MVEPDVERGGSLAARHPSGFAHRHRPDLDGIRGILAVCVVLLHYGINTLLLRVSHGMVHGFVFQLVVDVFFILSGFVLTAAETRRPRRDLGNFALRRALRLAPVFWLTTLLVIVSPPSGYPWALAPLELALAMPLAGYDPANFPAWSITWELYLPVLAYALAPRRPQVPASVSRAALIAALAGLAVADVLVAQGGRLYLVRAALGLLTGHLTHVGGPVLAGRWRGWHTPLLLAALFVVMAGAMHLPAIAGLAPFIGVLLVQSGAANDSALLSSRPAQWLGALSFTLYMTHVPVLWLAQVVLDPAIAGRPWLKLPLVVIAVALAWLLTRFVETPVMRWSRRLSAPA